MGIATPPHPTSGRDLNKNGRLDPYEDPGCPIEERVEDLLSQMTVEEKAGLLFQEIAPLEGGRNAPPGLKPARELVASRHMTHFNVAGTADPAAMARWYNHLQGVAERTRLGIPVTISSDPRHTFTNNPGASMLAGSFSQWPEPLSI